MATIAKKSSKQADVSAYLFNKKDVKKLKLAKADQAFVESEVEAGRTTILLPSHDSYNYYIALSADWNAEGKEAARKIGVELQQHVNRLKKSSLMIVNNSSYDKAAWYVAEGASLSNYQFLKYFKDKKAKTNSFQHVFVQDASISDAEWAELQGVVEGTELARTLINEPVSYLNATTFANEMAKAGKAAGFKTQILNKKQIEALKMGGLLGVNQGSIDPPTFTIMEYKPKNAKNKNLSYW